MRTYTRPRLAAGRLLLLLVLLVPLDASAARADACAGCPEPTLRRFYEEAAPYLRSRPGLLGDVPDLVYTDKGNCIVTMVGPPEVTPLYFWIEKRAEGEVWNCPNHKSHDTITITTSRGDSSSWTTTATAGLQLSGLGAKVTAAIARGHTTGVTITEVTSVSKTIIPAYCRRIPWSGWFLLGRFKAEAEFSVKQEWAWWTKNPTTGSTVHARGTLQVHCGNAMIEMQRHAPLSGFFRLTEGGCDDAECDPVTPRHRWFPPLPADVDEPGPDGQPPDEDPQQPPADEDEAGGEAPEGPVEEAGSDGPGEAGEPDAPPDGPSESGDLDDPPAGTGSSPLEGSGA